MRIQRFEDIKAWQEARELVKMIYNVTQDKEFIKDFGLVSQTRRAGISIMANIAEGFGESKRGFVQFLNYASSSNLELQSHLYVTIDQSYIAKEIFEKMYGKSKKVGNFINAFIKYLKGKTAIQQHSTTA